MDILKKKKERGKRAFTDSLIPNDNAEFKRRLLLFISLRKKCSNCDYIETKIDAE